MGGYKTVTASEGYRFRLTTVPLGSVLVGSYDEWDDTIRHSIGGGRYRSVPSAGTTIELVEIPKPEGVKHIKWIDPIFNLANQAMDGTEAFRANALREIIRTAKSSPYWPEPELDDRIHEWEIDASAFCCDGRYETLHIDSDGHWETHRHSTGPKHRVVSAGQAKRVRP